MTTLLLDTHVLLWAAERSSRLSARAAALIDDPTQVVAFSVVSLWEVVIKSGLGRRDFAVEAGQLRRAAAGVGMEELPVRGHHALAVAQLKPLHADPFDRLLLAQAAAERMTLLTADARLLAYGEPARQA